MSTSRRPGSRVKPVPRGAGFARFWQPSDVASATLTTVDHARRGTSRQPPTTQISVFHNWWPHVVLHPASFVIVGMAGSFAAAAKTPFSTLIIVSELTGGYTLLLPSLWVCTLSFILSDEQSIYASQVESRSRSPAHQGSYVREALAQVHVSKFLSPPSSLAALRPMIR